MSTALDNSLEAMIPALALHQWEYMGNTGAPDPMPTVEDFASFGNEVLPFVSRDRMVEGMREVNDEWVAEREEAQRLKKTRWRPHPLLKLAQAYLNTPRLTVRVNLRADRIFAASTAMVSEDHPRSERLTGIYKHAAHHNGQLVLPGFGPNSDIEGPAMPVALYQLGNDNPMKGGGRGAPLALRLWVEAILGAPYKTRAAGQPVAVDITLRELLNRLYPHRQPKPNEYWPRIEAAVKVLNDTKIPWYDPLMGKGGERQYVIVGNIPRGPGHLDDDVQLIVNLPPGSGQGPILSPRLHEWGARSAPAYFALLNLAYTWWDPGNTSHPATSEHSNWPQVVDDPERYPLLNRSRMVSITHPLSKNTKLRNTVAKSQATLQALADAGELRLVAGRALPPTCSKCGARALAGLPCSSSKCRAKKRAGD